jgi:hypothetical protein
MSERLLMLLEAMLSVSACSRSVLVSSPRLTALADGQLPKHFGKATAGDQCHRFVSEMRVPDHVATLHLHKGFYFRNADADPSKSEFTINVRAFFLSLLMPPARQRECRFGSFL